MELNFAISEISAVRQALEDTSSEWNDPDLYLHLRDYYASIETEAFTDLSAVVTHKKEPVLLAIANDVGGKIGYFGQPIRFIYNQSATQLDLAAFEKKIISTYLDHMNKSGLSKVEIISRHSQCLTPWQVWMMDKGAKVKNRYTAEADLALSIDDLWRDTRRRYRPFINKGKSFMQLNVMNGNNLNRESFSEFQEFHYKVAGRVTRPQASWDTMYEYIKAGKAELYQGYLDDQLIASTYCFFNTQTSLYGTGVYDREMFDKKISHWPMYFAMLRAKELNIEKFRLGETYPIDTSDKKTLDLGFFKKGFTSRVIAETIYEISTKDSQ